MRLFLILLLLWSSGEAREVTVAAAANVRNALQKIAVAFRRTHGTEVRIASASSGQLTAQILRGAPFDLMLSADMKYPRKLYRAGAALAPPRIYAYGTLVLWSTTGLDLRRGLQSLADPSVTRIALPNPRTAPYGVAAVAALEHAGLYETLRPRFVYGENVGQTSRYIFTGSAPVGLTAASVVHDPRMRGHGSYRIVPANLYTPIRQGVVLLRHGDFPEARAFYRYLFSPDARKILHDYGYRTPWDSGATRDDGSEK